VALKLQRLQSQVPIVDGAGRPAATFQRWWQTNAEAIEAQEGAQGATIADIQAAVARLESVAALANQALQAAQTAGSGGSTTSGGATAIVDVTTSWAPGPTVHLTGVTAGTFTASVTLTKTDTSVLAGGTLVASGYAGETIGQYYVYTAVGEFRIVENPGATTLYTGTFTVTMSTNNQGTSYSIAIDNPQALQDFSVSRSSTGAVDYELDLRMTTGGSSFNDVSAYLFANRP
jgi:hypothetical protein